MDVRIVTSMKSAVFRLLLRVKVDLFKETDPTSDAICRSTIASELWPHTRPVPISLFAVINGWPQV